MIERLRVVVSSVQRVLVSERLKLQNLMSTDAFLSSYVGDNSITHSGYRHAKELNLPILVFIKGERATQHESSDVARSRYEYRSKYVPSKASSRSQSRKAGRKIMLEVSADKIIVSSPGLPPAPKTIAKLCRGKYRPCSREEAYRDSDD